MSRGYYIAGNALVTVQQPAAAPGSTLLTSQELGLADGPIKVRPRFRHYDIKADDFGGEVPPSVLWMLGECFLDMILVHVDMTILDLCVREAMGGQEPTALAGAGTPMDGHYVVVTVQGQGAGNSYSIANAYLADDPIEVPLGAERSLVRCKWRGIPYKPVASEVVSAGAQLFARF